MKILYGVHFGEEIGMDDDQFGFGVVENILDFPGRKTIIEGDQGCTDEGGGEVGFEEDMTVVMQNGRLTAWSQAPVSQKMGQSKDPPGKLFIGEPPLMTANRFLLRIAPGRFG